MHKKHYDNLAFLLHLHFPKEWLYPYFNDINMLFQTIQHDKHETTFQSFFSRTLHSLDPVSNSFALEAFILSHVGNTLFSFNPETGDIEPSLVHHWSWNSSKSEWTFYLRKGVHFHNGLLLTAADVKFTLERLIDSDVNKWLYNSIERVNIENQFVVSIQINERHNVNILRSLATLSTTIIPNNTYTFEKDFIGTGPFTLVENNENKVILKTFDFYFGLRPMIDKAEFWILKNEEILPFLSKNEQRLEVDDGFNYLVFNSKSEIFCNSENRSFIAELINSNLNNNRKYGYFNDLNIVPKNLSDLKFKQSKHILLAFFENNNAQEDAQNLKKLLEQHSISVSLTRISKSDFFSSKETLSRIDILLAGELSSEDRDFSFLNFVFNDNMPIKKLLPTFFLNQVEQIRIKERDHELPNITRNIENELISNNYIIYLENKIKKHTVFDNLLVDNLSNSYGFLSLNDLWICD